MEKQLRRGCLYLGAEALRRWLCAGEFLFQEAGRVAFALEHHKLRCAFGHDVSALATALGAEVDDVVGAFDDVGVVLNDEHRVAALYQCAETFEELADVVEVEAGGRLVEDEEGGLAAFQAEIVGQLDALVLAAREGARGLPQFDVAQTYGLQRKETAHYLGALVLGEELYGLVDGHLQNVVDALSVEFYFEYLALKTLAVAGLAFEREVGHELHLYGHCAFALTLFASAALGVEAEESRREVHLLRQGLLGHEFANLVVGLDVGDGVGARRLADGILVDKLYALY